MSTENCVNAEIRRYNSEKRYNSNQMRLFSTHNNSDFLKLAEEGRPEETIYISDESEDNCFRVNVNHEIIEQIWNENETFEWMEELGFYSSGEFLVSRSIVLIDNLAFQLRIPLSIDWETLKVNDVITSGKHFEDFNAEITYANEIVVVQNDENENLYKLAYLTINDNQNN